ncbi:hypothetical protein [Variovorax sp. OK605]|uniref:hypothetical protein n=1 Tax=Variovorax sp. OK605 TaxID=1855317 RepID=UPI0011600E5A|nr:hypothetical protein [Variovorax sp. OK605]
MAQAVPVMAGGQLLALALTLAVEAPIVLLATARRRLTHFHELAPLRRIAAAFVPSCLTHPLAYRAIGNYGTHDYVAGLWLVESAVVLAEAVCLRWLLGGSFGMALLLSLLANAASVCVGWVLW